MWKSAGWALADLRAWMTTKATAARTGMRPARSQRAEGRGAGLGGAGRLELVKVAWNQRSSSSL